MSEILVTHHCGWCGNTYTNPDEDVCPVCGGKLFEYEVTLEIDE